MGEFKAVEGMWPRWTPRVREIYDASLAEHLDNERINFDAAFGVASQQCESPIEALFLVAALPDVMFTRELKIYPQRQFGSYRVDFYITHMEHRPDKPEWFSHAIVECDGHDYHERTKEQAERDKKRDREITRLGIPVFRFTGRELHRDAVACAKEVLDYLRNQLIRAELGHFGLEGED